MSFVGCDIRSGQLSVGQISGGVVFVASDPSNRAIFVFIKNVECRVGK